MQNDQSISISQLYPRLSPSEQKLAEENITAYLALVLRIYQRLEREGTLEVLTEVNPLPRMQTKVDSQQP